MLDKKIPISFIRNCCSCKKDTDFHIPEVSVHSSVEIEYRFEYNGPKIADVAYLENGNLSYVFEILNTHRTDPEKRPEPWFEIDAETFIKNASDPELFLLKIHCVRCEKCEDCILQEKREEEIRFERMKKEEEFRLERIKREEELRIERMRRETELKIEQMRKMKEEKINEIRQLIKENNERRGLDHDFYVDNSKENRKKMLETILCFVENDIDYEVCGNNVYEIKHHLTGEKIKYTSQKKVFINKKWIDLHISDLIKWYKNDKNNLIDKELTKKEVLNSGSNLDYKMIPKLNKTAIKNMLSKYLQSNSGELSEFDACQFYCLYEKFYKYEDGRRKYGIHEIEKVIIDTFMSKHFKIVVNGEEETLSISRFTDI
jgi:hypothetical protein